MRAILDFVASGSRYRPSGISCRFHSQHDFGAIKERGKAAGTAYDYGSSSLRFEEGTWHDQWGAMIRTVEPLMAQMKEAGAADFQVQFVVRGAEGIVLSLDAEHLKFLAAHDCDLRMGYGAEEEPNQSSQPMPLTRHG